MFGKKSSSGAKSKPKKSVKQGPKVNFFAAHAEKLVLGLVVGLLGFLVYEGVGGKGYDPSRQPPQLAEKATSISNNIKNGDPWPAIKDTVPAEHNYTPKTQASRLPTDDKMYGTFPMGGAGGQPFVKRGDPKLLAPIKIVGQSVMGLIAVEANEDYVDPFEDFEDAVKLKGKGSGSSNNKGRNQKNEAMGGGMEGGMGDMMGGGMGGGMGGMSGTKRFFPTKYNQGFSLGAGTGGMGGMGDMMGGGMGGMMEGGMGGMMGGAGGGMGGAMGGPGGAPGGGTTGGLNGAVRPKPKKFKAEPILFNAVTALVPHEDMLKEYEAKLRDSADYNAARDQPIYLDFEYQRCEVIPGQPDNWVEKGSAGQQLAMMREKKWLPAKPQTIPEVIDMTSYNAALTMPIPPLLFQDYRKFAKHPDIDWIWDAGMNQMQMQVPAPNTNQTDNTEQLLPGERPMTGGAMGGMGGGMGGMMGGMGGGMGDMAGGGMMGGAGDMMGGGMGGGMDGGMGGMMGGMGDMMGGGMGGGMEGGMGGMMGGMGDMMGGGMGGGMGGMMGGGMNFMPAKYKMIRFYDELKTSDIGKTFKYRIRLKMEDPNYPSERRFKVPPDNDLEPQVFARVAKARAKDDPIVEQYRVENIKARQVALANKTMPKLKFHTREKLLTDWSEPSKGIYVRGVDDVYVHKMGKKQGNEVEAVIVRLDLKKGAYVPMYFFVEDEEALKKQAEEKDEKAKPPKIAKVNVPAFKRGAVVALGTPLTTQFAHPITNVIKRWLGYEGFDKGWNTVVDVRGGDPLAGNKANEDPLTDNVEMMMLMSDGRVQVSTEFDDAPRYRGFTLTDEREGAEKGNTAPGMGGGMDGGGGMMGGGGKNG